MREIPLTQGQVALVDDSDYDMLIKYRWYATYGKHTYYAARHDPDREPQRIIMHREILKPAVGVQIDHINRDGLDNQRHNLRVCTLSENMHNSKLHRHNTTGYRGIRQEGTGYRAAIRVNRHALYGPKRLMMEDAARDYDILARTHYGDNTFQNFPST